MCTIIGLKLVHYWLLFALWFLNNFIKFTQKYSFWYGFTVFCHTFAKKKCDSWKLVKSRVLQGLSKNVSHFLKPKVWRTTVSVYAGFSYFVTLVSFLYKLYICKISLLKMINVYIIAYFCKFVYFIALCFNI